MNQNPPAQPPSSPDDALRAESQRNLENCRWVDDDYEALRPLHAAIVAQWRVSVGLRAAFNSNPQR